MPRQVPYLQRRGFGLSFRIAVPADLWLRMGMREITKALPTSDRTIATPMALSLAGQAKFLFIRMRGMTKGGKVPDSAGNQFGYTLEYEFDQAGRPKRLKIEAEPHEQDAVDSAIRIVVEAAEQRRKADPLIETDQVFPTTGTNPVGAPLFSEVIDDFLTRYRLEKKAAMLKKHTPVLSLLLEIIGDKSISEIKQNDFNKFFDLLRRLPPRWRDECRKARGCPEFCVNGG